MEANPKQRRRHSAAFIAHVLAACAEPGASVAAVALSFKLNDHPVHQWRRGRDAGPRPGTTSMAVAESTPQFIALYLPIPPPAAPPSIPMAADVRADEIRLELKRGAIGVSVKWPISVAAIRTLSSTAIGKDYLGVTTFINYEPGDIGWKVLLLGQPDLTLARDECPGMNVLGLGFGIDVDD